MDIAVTGRDEQRKHLTKSLSDVVCPTFDSTENGDRLSSSLIERPKFAVSSITGHIHHKMKVLSRRDTPRVVSLTASDQKSKFIF